MTNIQSEIYCRVEKDICLPLPPACVSVKEKSVHHQLILK